MLGYFTYLYRSKKIGIRMLYMSVTISYILVINYLPPSPLVHLGSTIFHIPFDTMLPLSWISKKYRPYLIPQFVSSNTFHIQLRSPLYGNPVLENAFMCNTYIPIYSLDICS